MSKEIKEDTKVQDDQTNPEADMRLKLLDMECIWRNNGRDLSGKQHKIQDALSTSDAPLLLPKVISNIVKEEQEPLLVGTSLLQRINYSAGRSITFPAVGGLVAEDIPEGGEYPERTLNMGGANVTATIGKTGIAVSVTDEMLRYSQFDVIGMHLRAAGRALARHKEEKIFNYIRSMGVPVFDNRNPTQSLHGVTHGRGEQGAANGSLIMDDLFDAYGHILTQGFIPNTLLMHPLTFISFVKDPTMRAFMLASGGGTFFASWTGNAATRAPWDNSNQNKLGLSSGQKLLTPNSQGGNPSGSVLSALEEYSQTMTSAPQLPSYFNLPLRIIVSPYVKYSPRTKLTDVLLFDSAELGALIVDEDVTTEEFDDPTADIRKIKLRERYGIGIFNEGNAIAVLRNIKVVPNEIVTPAQTQIQISGSIGPIDPATPVV